MRPSVVYHLASAVTGSRSLDIVRPTLASNLSAGQRAPGRHRGRGDRVVLIGSGDELADGAAPCSPYAAAVVGLAGYARMFRSLYGTPVTTARTFMVYGPDQPDRSKLVPYTITSLLRGEAPELTSGQRLVDWVYVDDVIDALLAVAEAPRPWAGRSTSDPAVSLGAPRRGDDRRHRRRRRHPPLRRRARPAGRDRVGGRRGRDHARLRLGPGHRPRRGPEAHRGLVRRVGASLFQPPQVGFRPLFRPSADTGYTG